MGGLSDAPPFAIWAAVYLAVALFAFIWFWVASYQVGIEDGDDFEDNVMYSTLTSFFGCFAWPLVFTVVAALLIIAFLDLLLPGRRGPRWMKEINQEDD